MDYLLKNFNHFIVGSSGKIGSQLFNELNEKENGVKVFPVSKNDLSNMFLNESTSKRSNVFYWCAGKARANSSKSECLQDYESLNKFLSLCSQSNKPNYLIFLSSGGSVYGTNPGEVDELTTPNPQSYYGEMKRASEILIENTVGDCIRGAIVLRLANVYGGNNNNKISGLVDSALNLKEIKLISHPSSRKQYGRNLDYARNLLPMVSNFQNSKFEFEMRNFFPPYSYSIENIIHLIQNKCNLKLKWKYAVNEHDLPHETVILRNVDSKAFYEGKWTSLEDYLDAI